jgi:hypothetical protein
LKYLIDTCWTLQALVNCLPQAAALLLHPSNHGGVLLALGTTYSTLLPLLYRVSQQPVTAAGSGLRVSQVERLQHCVVSVVFQLLCAAFCTPEGAAASGGPDAIAAAAAATSSSSSSGVRKPPPGFGTQQAAAAVGQYDPDQQGQQLMNLLMLLSHPNDHEVLPGFGSTGSSSTQPALLAAVNRTFHLDAAVEAAVQQVRVMQVIVAPNRFLPAKQCSTSCTAMTSSCQEPSCPVVFPAAVGLTGVVRGRQASELTCTAWCTTWCTAWCTAWWGWELPATVEQLVRKVPPAGHFQEG